MFSKKEILPIVIIIAVFLLGAIFYPSLPEKVPTHWNTQGEIDDWSSKNFAVFFFPAITLAIYLLMLFLPLVDPLRKNYIKFAKSYYWLRTVFIIFFALLYAYTLVAAMGVGFDIRNFIIPLIGLLFIVIGLFMPSIKKNYFVGIRTPWTIHSEETWNKTHQFGGKVFIIAGILTLLTLLCPEYAFAIFMAVILGIVVLVFVYSYLIFRRISRRN